MTTAAGQWYVPCLAEDGITPTGRIAACRSGRFYKPLSTECDVACLCAVPPTGATIAIPATVSCGGTHADGVTNPAPVTGGAQFETLNDFGTCPKFDDPAYVSFETWEGTVPAGAEIWHSHTRATPRVGDIQMVAYQEPGILPTPPIPDYSTSKICTTFPMYRRHARFVGDLQDYATVWKRGAYLGAANPPKTRGAAASVMKTSCLTMNQLPILDDFGQWRTAIANNALQLADSFQHGKTINKTLAATPLAADIAEWYPLKRFESSVWRPANSNGFIHSITAVSFPNDFGLMDSVPLSFRILRSAVPTNTLQIVFSVTASLYRCGVKNTGTGAYTTAGLYAWIGLGRGESQSGQPDKFGHVEGPAIIIQSSDMDSVLIDPPGTIQRTILGQTTRTYMNWDNGSPFDTASKGFVKTVALPPQATDAEWITLVLFAHNPQVPSVGTRIQILDVSAI